MNRKGFTLIELLATITILSIILLITFVSMSSVVKNSKNNLHDSQINQIEKAAEYYNNKEGLKDYDICINVEDLIDKGYIKQDEIKDPKDGKNIEGSVNISYNGKKYSYKYQENLCTYSFIKLVSDTDNDGEISIGDEYTFKVNATDTFHFYVLSIDGTGENQKVNLIMNQNICTDGTLPTSTNPCLIAWYSTSDDNSNGPTTAMEGLYNATKNWTNVPKMNLEYDDIIDNTLTGYTGSTTYGYKGISVTNGVGTITNKAENSTTPIGATDEPLRARLPKISEVYNTGTDDNHCHSSFGSCPTWLTNGLNQYSTYYPDNDHIAGIYGYWTLSSYPGSSIYARDVIYRGSGDGHPDSSYASSYGLRAVITVSMSDLS